MKIALRSSVLALALALAAAGCGKPDADPVESTSAAVTASPSFGSWGIPQELTGSTNSTNDVIVAAAGSTVHVAWQQGVGATAQLRYRRSTDNGATFAAATTLVTGGDDAQLVVTGNVVLVAWRDVTVPSAEQVLRLARSTNGGASFAAPVTLSAGKVGPFKLLADGNAAAVLYHDTVDGTTVLRARRSADAGATFAAATDRGANALLAAAIDGTSIYYVTRGLNSVYGYLYFYASNDGGATFAAATTLATVSYPYASYPSYHGVIGNAAVAASEGHVYVGWVDGSASESYLYGVAHLAMSHDRGATITSRKVQDSTNAAGFYASDPVYVAASGTMVAMGWRYQSRTTISLSTNGGTSFNGGGIYTTSLDVALGATSGRLAAAYVNTNGGAAVAELKSGSPLVTTVASLDARVYGVGVALAGDHTYATWGSSGLSFNRTPVTDADADGLATSGDNCPYDDNPDQADQDGDGIGNACDPDRDGDDIANTVDVTPDAQSVEFANGTTTGRVATRGTGPLLIDAYATAGVTLDASAVSGAQIEACNAIVLSGLLQTTGATAVRLSCSSSVNISSGGSPGYWERRIEGELVAQNGARFAATLSVSNPELPMGFVWNPATGCVNLQGGSLALKSANGTTVNLLNYGTACASAFEDADGDGVGDGADNCKAVPNPDQVDRDGDRVGDACDNCPTTSNSDQLNSDGDATGNACDANPTCNDAGGGVPRAELDACMVARTTCEQDRTSLVAARDSATQSLTACQTRTSELEASAGVCASELATERGAAASCRADLTAKIDALAAKSGELATCRTDLTAKVDALAAKTGELATANGALDTCRSDLGQTAASLTTCRADLAAARAGNSDADADGIPDRLDRCAATAARAEVDASGCSHAQFCAGFDLAAKLGEVNCLAADWKNDEPLAALDCTLRIDRGLRTCVPVK
jgi:hypothetical protein